MDSHIGQRGITGIQRVQECLVRALLGHSDKYSFIFIDSQYGRVWALDPVELTKLINNQSAAGNQRSSLKFKQLAERLRDGATLQRLNRIDLLVNLGCFWTFRYGKPFEKQIKTSGCQYIPLIYDLIPVDHPDLCVGNTVQDFKASLPQTLCKASAIVTISRHTKKRIERYAIKAGIRVPPIYVLPLAHQLSTSFKEVAESGSREFPQPDKFVLAVGTFEPRKNYLRLAEAWTSLANDIFDMPILIIAGKTGWLDAVSMERLIQLAERSKKIIFDHDITDEKLRALYKLCLFTVFISLDEGWGLPVGESLSFGKVCLASNSGAIPEVGREFIVYVDPLSVKDIVAALRSLIVNDRFRLELENRISVGFRARTWAEVASNLLTLVGKAID